jgi:hypothetical protein
LTIILFYFVIIYEFTTTTAKTMNSEFKIGAMSSE